VTSNSVPHCGLAVSVPNLRISPNLMTGVVDSSSPALANKLEVMEEKKRSSFIPETSPCTNSSSPTPDNAPMNQYYTPLLTPSNSSTSCSPPPLNMLESLAPLQNQPTAFTTLIKPSSPAKMEAKDSVTVKKETVEDNDSGNWSMHLDVLR